AGGEAVVQRDDPGQEGDGRLEGCLPPGLVGRRPPPADGPVDQAGVGAVARAGVGGGEGVVGDLERRGRPPAAGQRGGDGAAYWRAVTRRAWSAAAGRERMARSTRPASAPSPGPASAAAR